MRGGRRRCGIIKNGLLRSRIRIKLRIRVTQKYIRHIVKQKKQASINNFFPSISEIGVKFHRKIFHCEEFHCQEFHCEEFNCEEFHCQEFHCQEFHCEEFHCEEFQFV